MAPKPNKKPDGNGVSLADLTAAKAAAARTGVPQPVKDASGKTVYYVDYDGSIVPSAIATDRRQQASQSADGGRAQAEQSGVLNSSGGINTAKERQAAQQQQAEQQQQTATSAALKNQQASLVGGPVWVNGQMQIVTGFHSDGTPIFGYQGANAPNAVIDPRTGQPLPKGVQSAFDALSMNSYGTIMAGIQGTDRFTMAQNAPTDVFTGLPAGGAYANPNFYTPPGVGETPAAAEHSYSANVATNGTSQMTIAQGVQWLVNLSQQNPDAYNKLVVELRHAGYYGTDPSKMIGGNYSEEVGVAFAKAAKDLSVVQQTTGSSIGLDQYLQQKMSANEQYAAQSTPLVQRNYTDPNALMATAKQAAQDAIGRNLTPQELATFEQAFRGQENTYYDQVDAYNKAKAMAQAIGDSAPSQGFSAVQPDASASAQSLVQGPQFGQERANYSAQNYYQAIAQMFGIK